MTNLKELNNAAAGAAILEFSKCCSSTVWAERMVSARPFSNVTEVLHAADDIWNGLNEQDWLEAFAGHPKIGDKISIEEKFAATAESAKGEQSGVEGAADDVVEKLADGNRRYQEKFGFIFIVFASGKSAPQMLALLNERLPHKRKEELRIAAVEQAKITRLRLEKLLMNPSHKEGKPTVEVVEAITEQDIRIARELFVEYAKSIDIDICFQNFDKEVEGLPGEYAPPDGRLLLASCETKIAGCVALKRIDNEVCEMKRLYVRSEFRGKSIGRKLTMDVMEQARNAGYRKVRLDTLPTMKEAIALYRSLGFETIAPFRDLGVRGALFMQASLR